MSVTDNVTQVVPQLNVELLYHFGSDLPDQARTILSWIEHIFFVTERELSATELVSLLSSGVASPYPLRVELTEVEALLKHGVVCCELEQLEDGMYRLSIERKNSLQNAIEAVRLTEKAVKDSWCAEIVKAYPALIEEDLSELWTGLKKFLLYEARKYAFSLTNASSLPNDFSTYVGQVYLQDIAKTEYPAFLLFSIEGSKHLFSRFLAHVLHLYRSSISDQSSVEVKQHLRGLRLYLDTNLLIAYLGLTGDPIQYEGVSRAMDLAIELGFKLVVTQKTISEYKHVLVRLKNEIQGQGYSTPQHTTSQSTLKRVVPSLIRGFHAISGRTGLTIEQFYDRYIDLESYLTESGLNEKVVVEATLSAEQIERIQESEIYASAKDLMLHNERKADKAYVIDHDAFHLAFIAEERGGDHRWANAKAFFLTLDRQLVLLNRDLAFRFPIVLSLDEWLLTFRQFLSRVDNFEQFFASIVANTLITDYWVDGKILSRVEAVVNAARTSPEAGRTLREVVEFAIRHGGKLQLERSIEANTDVEFVEAIEALVHHHQAEQLQLAKSRLSELEAERDAAATQLKDTEIESTKLKQQIELLESRQAQDAQKMDALTSELGSSRSELQKTNEDVQQLKAMFIQSRKTEIDTAIEKVDSDIRAIQSEVNSKSQGFGIFGGFFVLVLTLSSLLWAISHFKLSLSDVANWAQIISVVGISGLVFAGFVASKFLSKHILNGQNIEKLQILHTKKGSLTEQLKHLDDA